MNPCSIRHGVLQPSDSDPSSSKHSNRKMGVCSTILFRSELIASGDLEDELRRLELVRGGGSGISNRGTKPDSQLFCDQVAFS